MILRPLSFCALKRCKQRTSEGGTSWAVVLRGNFRPVWPEAGPFFFNHTRRKGMAMMSTRGVARVAAVAAMVLLAAGAAQAAIIDTVPVGNPGNAADTTGYGSVAYTYNIGKYDVTAGQYTAFLNAVAATDTYGLYNTSM